MQAWIDHRSVREPTWSRFWGTKKLLQRLPLLLLLLGPWSLVVSAVAAAVAPKVAADVVLLTALACEEFPGGEPSVHMDLRR